MDRMDFTQAIATISVLETKLLSGPIIEKMIEAKDAEQALKILGETDYGSSIEELDRVEEYEEVLSSEVKELYQTMYDIPYAYVAADLLALKYDYHNLKVLVKEKTLEKDLEELYSPIGSTDFQKIKESYLNDDMSKLDPRFRKALNIVTSDFESTKDPQRIELILDKFYFEHMHALAEKSGVLLFKNYVKDLIDFTNMRTLIRLKKQEKDIKFLEEVLIPNGSASVDKIVLSLNDTLGMIINKFKCYDIRFELEDGLVSYQRTGSLSDFEKQMDNYLMSLVKRAKYITFGPERIFAYMVAKEMEIKVLRIIMVSKLNQLSPDSIRERLRDLYV